MKHNGRDGIEGGDVKGREGSKGRREWKGTKHREKGIIRGEGLQVLTSSCSRPRAERHDEMAEDK